MATDSYKKISLSSGHWDKHGKGISRQTLFWEEKNALKSCVFKLDAGVTLGEQLVYIGADMYVIEGEVHDGKETVPQGEYVHYPSLFKQAITAKKASTILMVMYGPVESTDGTKKLL